MSAKGSYTDMTGEFAMSALPRKQTSFSTVAMSALCQYQTSLPNNQRNDPADFDSTTPSDAASGTCARG
jgi:hypothetical protein